MSINFKKETAQLIEGGIAVDEGLHYKEDGIARKLADEKGYLNYFDFENNLTTAISTDDTFVKLNTDTTQGFSRNGLSHSNNRITNSSNETKIVALHGIVSLSAGSNQQLHGAFFKNETLVPCAEQSGITGAGERTSAVPFQCLTELEPGDFVEVFVKNKTATTDIVCDNVNVIAIEL